MKERLFQFFFCIYIFWSPILFSLLGGFGAELDSSIMRLVLVGITAISWSFYFSISPKYPEEKKIILLLILFGIMYYCTQFFHKEIAVDRYNLYLGQLLRWGADCSSACVIGMTLLKLKNFNLIHKILPYVCIILTPFLLMTIVKGSLYASQYVDSGGLNYQLLAYYMAVLFCFSLYYSFIYKHKQSKIIHLMIIVLMPIQAVACCMSGGRGGVVLLVAYIIYMGYYMLKRNIISKGKLVALLLACFAGFFLVAGRLNLWESAGFQRSSGLINNDDRFGLWKEYLPFFEQSPLFGNGLGSDYFTWGFYSHNIFIDFLVELGIVGTIIMIIIFWKTYKKLFYLTNQNESFVVLMIISIYGFIMNLFSGYWITTYTNWMAFGAAISYLNYFRFNKRD